MQASNLDMEGRGRVAIEAVEPEIDGGRFAIKRTIGESVDVCADIFADGHDLVGAAVLFRRSDENGWRECLMTGLGDDRWRATFQVKEIGGYLYTIQGWIDRFATWRRDFATRIAADQAELIDLLIGAEMVQAASTRAAGRDGEQLTQFARLLRRGDAAGYELGGANGDQLEILMARYADRRWATTYDRELAILVERDKARFSAWYELFPRSCGASGAHGTLKDCAARLPYIAAMGFDTVYLPPLHPIGSTHRKGANNALLAAPGDPGSPWAIGAATGGHKEIHPELGTFDDFDRLMQQAHSHGLEVALDLAFQCTPDHPYVTTHPDWFRHRPDGAIQYAENPPKKYQDIYPIDFESADWRSLWQELESVARFWLERGVRIFRVDNPHTKPFTFWQQLLEALRRDYPEAIFLAEAFTRPKVMRRLAKLGFSQSYTYFAWRNTSRELTEYFTELTRSPMGEYFRAHLWPNTPDILTEYLQFGGRPAFVARLVLAATLGANYGIYGPAFELCENRAREAGSEEYLDSEKYQLRHWNLDDPASLKDLITRINRIRRENRALQSDRSLHFHRTDNEQLICYSKATEDCENIMIMAVNLDPRHRQSGWALIDLHDLGLESKRTYQLHDLISDSRFLWQGPRLYLELDPAIVPAHVFRLRHRVRSERQFDYFM